MTTTALRVVGFKKRRGGVLLYPKLIANQINPIGSYMVATTTIINTIYS